MASLAFAALLAFACLVGADALRAEPASNASGLKLVRVDFFVMSLCPDTAWCDQVFGPVLEAIADKVPLNVQYTFLAEVENGLACKHGGKECVGNRWGLCAQEAAAGDVKQLVRFFRCQTYNQSGIPDNGPHCSMEAGINVTSMRSCVASNHSRDLMEESAKSAIALGIEDTCIVKLNRQPFCTHDGGRWKDCDTCGDDKAECLYNALTALADPALAQKSSSVRMRLRSEIAFLLVGSMVLSLWR
mmetsp:Transcript_68877/g.165336  ORF Transcript_68877/g.165336 Transcript_68877/m.165336 type:complete len:245 (+) Transcript_68877:169-903(+)|eukprot:CAMPEP_0178427554 /NCGR_PEP_ID=MMETSP0689_2-20121128/29807_1 /TAXON_ID=160604 /ORGANISM="Amphidinium massartii, Strain CS-259" /LENGTH=244 /DNA_ID=CAMNT_0020049269 /DNA_START=96 /DNA_END=830 /DNA_ORIENTATION=+